MNEILTAIMNLSTLVFVVTGMLAMGLSLTIAQIVAPLRNARLVILALLANFVLVPLRDPPAPPGGGRITHRSACQRRSVSRSSCRQWPPQC